MLKAAVVCGVSTVAKPITPIFIPLANAKICEEVCLGKKSFYPFYDLKLAAMLFESFDDMNGNKNVGPKSNSWFPIADPSTLLRP